MSATTSSRRHRIVSRITAKWAEMGYAQRRLVEIQTGITGLTGQHHHTTRAPRGEVHIQQ